MDITPVLELSQALVSQRDFPTYNAILLSLLLASIHNRQASRVIATLQPTDCSMQVEDDGNAATVQDMLAVARQLKGVAQVHMETWSEAEDRLVLRNEWITTTAAAAAPPSARGSSSRQGTVARVYDVYAQLPVRRQQLLMVGGGGNTSSSLVGLRRHLERLVLMAPGCALTVTVASASAPPFFSHTPRRTTLDAFASLFGQQKADGLEAFTSSGGEFCGLASRTQRDLHHSRELQFVFTAANNSGGGSTEQDLELEQQLRGALNLVFRERSKINFVQLTSVHKRTSFPVFVICLESSELVSRLMWGGKRQVREVAERMLDCANWTRQRFDEERRAEQQQQQQECSNRAGYDWANNSACPCHPGSSSSSFSAALAKHATKALPGSTLRRREQVRLTPAMLDGSRVVGQVNDEFIIIRLVVRTNDDADEAQQLWCIDQHAADERVRYERFQRDTHALRQTGTFPSRVEDKPVKLRITPTERHKLEQHRALATSWGYTFDIAADGDDDNTAVAVVSAVPLVMGARLQANTLLELVDNSEDGGGGDDCPLPFRRALASRACRGAIMFGTTLSDEQCNQLVQELAQCRLPFQCAHGRPTVAPLGVQLSE